MIHGSLIQRDRSDPSWTPDTLLPTAIAHVDQQRIDRNVGASQRADRIDNKNSVVLPAKFSNLFQRLTYA